MSAGPARGREMPLFVWDSPRFRYTNFGDHLSRKVVEAIIPATCRVRTAAATEGGKLLAVGSILHYARDQDVVWGSGVNGNRLELSDYKFSMLDIRAVRGPLTQEFIQKRLRLHCPAVFGDPALLLPRLYPSFVRSEPEIDCLVIPHFNDKAIFSSAQRNVMFPHEHPWRELLSAILKAALVISSSLHGIVVAEAFGVPARLLRVSQRESLFKYADYYAGTNRPDFTFASSVDEAREMGGEQPGSCDLSRLLDAFPCDLLFEAARETCLRS